MGGLDRPYRILFTAFIDNRLRGVGVEEMGLGYWRSAGWREEPLSYAKKAAFDIKKALGHGGVERNGS